MNGLREVIALGLPGPSHGFGGLAAGNQASQHNGGRSSAPRQAALQVLDLAALLLDLGVPSVVLPPHSRPHLASLRALGYDAEGASPEQVIDAVATDDPELLRQLSSAAAMWCANLATVIPGADLGHGRSIIQVANLSSQPHRAIEAATGQAVLAHLLAGVAAVDILPPLPASWRDEGAANHLRVGQCHVLVHGGGHGWGALPRVAPARQHPRASRALIRRAGLAAERSLLVQQQPTAIDAGVFHNDVIALSHDRRLWLHHHAWCEQSAVLAILAQRCPGLRVDVVSNDELSLAEAVTSYLFNSQVVTSSDGRVVLIAPGQCASGRPAAVIDRWIANGLIDEAHCVAVDQSMANGGGPACLRLRLPLTEQQLAQLAPGLRLDREQVAWLRGWVTRWYPAQATANELADPVRWQHDQAALRELSDHCGLPPGLITEASGDATRHSPDSLHSRRTDH